MFRILESQMEVLRRATRRRFVALMVDVVRDECRDFAMGKNDEELTSTLSRLVDDAAANGIDTEPEAGQLIVWMITLGAARPKWFSDVLAEPLTPQGKLRVLHARAAEEGQHLEMWES